MEIILISLCLTTLFAFLFRRSHLNRTTTKLNHPPSPWRLPLIGNLHQLSVHPHRTFRSLSLRYGPLMLLHFGRVPVLLVSSADVAHDVMKTHDLKFSNRPRIKAVDIILNGGRDLVFSSNNEYWRQMKDTFFGGGTTTFTTLDWAMMFLIRHPECMKKVRDEIRTYSRHKSYVTEEETENMKYLKAVITEVLRLHPPGPLLIPRQLSEDVKLKGYDISKGTQVLINAWAIQRDTATWGLDADEFKPERHLDRPCNFLGQDFNLIPFGSGRRLCPGIGFAMVLIEVALANLVNRFNWRVEMRPLGDDDEYYLAETTGIEVCRKFPLVAFPSSALSTV